MVLGMAGWYTLWCRGGTVMNEELRNVRKRISILEQELSQLKKKEATFSQVLNTPDIVGKYFKITNSPFIYYIKVKHVNFSSIFNKYVAIGPVVEFDTRLIGTTGILRSESLFSYDSSTWEEITKEDYDNAVKEVLTYFQYDN